MKERLIEKKRELEALLGTCEEGLVVERVGDDMEKLMAQASREQASEDLSRWQGVLAEVYDALGRVNTPSWGLCQGCDHPISPKRLEALPWASLCLGCQEKQEIPRGSRALATNRGHVAEFKSRMTHKPYTGEWRGKRED